MRPSSSTSNAYIMMAVSHIFNYVSLSIFVYRLIYARYVSLNNYVSLSIFVYRLIYARYNVSRKINIQNVYDL